MNKPVEPKRKDFKNEERYQEAYDRYLSLLDKYNKYIQSINKKNHTK